MNKEELIQFLKNNLKIELSKVEDWETTELEVRLYLGNEIISSEFICIGK